MLDEQYLIHEFKVNITSDQSCRYCIILTGYDEKGTLPVFPT
jgi:hypothetical protein